MTPLLTVQQLADWLQVTTETVYRLANKGEIPAIRVGSQYRFDQVEVLESMREGK